MRVAVTLAYDSVPEFLRQHALNISRGGLFVRTSDPKPVGTSVAFSLQLKSGGPIIRGKGTVRWISRPGEPGRAAGMGIKFTELDEESQILIDLVVAERGQAADSDEPPRPEELAHLPDQVEGAPARSPLSTAAPPTGPPVPIPAVPLPSPATAVDLAAGLARLKPANRFELDRKHHRFRTELPLKISYGRPPETLERRALNVSRGGLFVFGRTPGLATGDLVTFSLEPTTQPEQIKGSARVRWIRTEGAVGGEPPGAGLEFESLEEGSRAALALLLAEQLNSGAPSRGMPKPPESPPIAASGTSPAQREATLPPTPEREKRLRVRLPIKLTFVDQGLILERKLLDISRGGMFVESVGAVDPGSLVRFSVELAGETLRGTAKVRWARADASPGRPAGLGLQFDELTDDCRRLIEQLMSTGSPPIGRPRSPGDGASPSENDPPGSDAVPLPAPLQPISAVSPASAPPAASPQRAAAEQSAMLELELGRLRDEVREAIGQLAAQGGAADHRVEQLGELVTSALRRDEPTTSVGAELREVRQLLADFSARTPPTDSAIHRQLAELREAIVRLGAERSRPVEPGPALEKQLAELREAVARLGAERARPDAGPALERQLGELRELVRRSIGDLMAVMPSGSSAPEGQLKEIREELRRLSDRPAPAAGIAERQLVELRDQLLRAISELGGRKPSAPTPPSSAAQAMEAILARRFGEAEAILLRGGAENPSDPSYRKELGYLYLRWSEGGEERLVDAEAAFSRAAAVNPKDAGALVQLGLVQARRGRTADARRSFNDALKRDPGFEPARSALAQLGSKALPRSPTIAAAAGGIVLFVGLGLLVGRASAPAPPAPVSAPVASAQLAEAQLSQLREELRRSMQEALAKLPAPAPASLTPPAQVPATRPGDGDDTESAQRQARAGPPKNVAKPAKPSDGGLGKLVAKGDGALRAGRVDDALTAYREALAKSPNYATAHRGMGAVLVMQGKDGEAKAAYQKYLQLAPTASDANRIRALLEEM